MLPLSSVHQYPSFLSTSTDASDARVHVPLESLKSLRNLDRFTQVHRTELASAVLSDLSAWGAPESAIASAELLRQHHTYAVVTGQQAGIAGGPLYTLYKAVGTIRAAEKLSLQFPGHRFVPVFWMEADDHDFDEARRLVVLDSAAGVCKLSYDDGDARSLSVGDRVASELGIETLLADLRTALAPTEFTDSALDLIAESYRHGNLADGFVRFMYALLRETPLVIVDSRNARLKKLAADVIAADALNPFQLFDAITERTHQLQTDGVPTPISPKSGALFMMRDGVRRHLDLFGDHYVLRGTEVKLFLPEAAELAIMNPEQFSPNVALRPIVQDAVLPTAAYVAGPTEMAYLNQIRDAYQLFGIDPPHVVARPFVQIVEPKVRRVIERYELTFGHLLQKDFDPAAFILDQELLAELDASTKHAIEHIETAYSAFTDVTEHVDPTMLKSLAAGRTAAEKSAQDFSKRLHSALRRREQIDIDRLEYARRLTLPGNGLQERVLSVLYFVNKYSIAEVVAVLHKIDIRDSELQLIDIGAHS